MRCGNVCESFATLRSNHAVDILKQLLPRHPPTVERVTATEILAL
jgi:hypothetical protein